MENKAVNNLVDILRDLVAQETEHIDRTIVAQVSAVNKDGTYDLFIEGDTSTVLHKISSIAGSLNKGDNVYVYKITNNLANSFIIKKIGGNVLEDRGITRSELYEILNSFNLSSGKQGGGVSGTITGVSAGFGLEGGGSSGNVSLSVDRSQIQEKLISGDNIKTINNQSLLGSGNITIQGGVAELLPQYMVLGYNLVTNAKQYTMPNGVKFGPETSDSGGNIYRVYQDRNGDPITSESDIKAYLKVMTGSDTINYYNQQDGADCYLFLVANNTTWKLQRNAASAITGSNQLWAWKVARFPFATKADLPDVSNFVQKSGDTMTGPLWVHHIQGSASDTNTNLLLTNNYTSSEDNDYSTYLNLRSGTNGFVLGTYDMGMDHNEDPTSVGFVGIKGAPYSELGLYASWTGAGIALYGSGTESSGNILRVSPFEGITIDNYHDINGNGYYKFPVNDGSTSTNRYTIATREWVQQQIQNAIISALGGDY